MILAWEQYSAEKPEETLWDAVIVGTGMGGATLGYSLARMGLKVLFLERGGARRGFPRGGMRADGGGRWGLNPGNRWHGPAAGGR